MKTSFIRMPGFIVLFTLVIATFCPYGNEPSNLTQAEAARAFPGAEGFGTDTPGGRGGKVIYVTNLENSGPGSLRTALTAQGPRMVLFNVSGTINLASDINIYTPFLTVAGQTAPGEGVQIRGGHIRIATHDVIIRYLKVRSGDEGNRNQSADRDAITINHTKDAYNIVIDHSTLIWGPDIGGLSFLYGAYDATVSYSIIGEGLYLSRHHEAISDMGGHSMAMNITELDSNRHPRRITAHHNLLTTSSDRNPRVVGGENIDFVNNVVYNWQHGPSQGNPRSLNLIKNFYIMGPMTTNAEALVAWLPKVEKGGDLRNASVYELGNEAEGFSELRGRPFSVYANQRFAPYSMVNEDSPLEAYYKIVEGVGANLQVAGQDGRFVNWRDRVDGRIVSNLIHRQGVFYNGTTRGSAASFEAISWPELAGAQSAIDEDQDGMPDAWEIKFFGDTLRGDPEDSSGDLDNDGYTDLEEYLNQTDPTQ